MYLKCTDDRGEGKRGVQGSIPPTWLKESRQQRKFLVVQRERARHLEGQRLPSDEALYVCQQKRKKKERGKCRKEKTKGRRKKQTGERNRRSLRGETDHTWIDRGRKEKDKKKQKSEERFEKQEVLCSMQEQ